jgi:hypothetical protein
MLSKKHPELKPADRGEVVMSAEKEDLDCEAIAFFANTENKIRKASLTGTLEMILDSGCSDHMVPCKGLLTIRQLHYTTVMVANGEKLQVNHIGTLRGDFLCDGVKSTVMLNEVLEVKGLNLALISLRKLAQNGIIAVFEKDLVELIKNS